MLTGFAKFRFKKSENIQQLLMKILEIRERCNGVHGVDLGESFPTRVYLKDLASTQPRTSPKKGSKVRALGNLKLDFENFEALFKAQCTISRSVLHPLKRLRGFVLPS